jgi:hypothetical protein
MFCKFFHSSSMSSSFPFVLFKWSFTLWVYSHLMLSSVNNLLSGWPASPWETKKQHCMIELSLREIKKYYGNSFPSSSPWLDSFMDHGIPQDAGNMLTATQRHTPEDWSSQLHHCENLQTRRSFLCLLVLRKNPWIKFFI